MALPRCGEAMPEVGDRKFYAERGFFGAKGKTLAD